MAVVVNRSNSRNWGDTEADVVTKHPGCSSRTMAAARSSWGGVDPGEQEAHRDRLHAFVPEPAGGAPHRLLVERDENLARRRGDSLGHREAVPAADEGPVLPRDLLPDRIVLGSLVAADVDDVAVALARDHAGARALVGGGPRWSRWWCRGRRVRSRPGTDPRARRAPAPRRAFRATGPSGVVGTLWMRMSSVSASANTTSVKVPPMSTPNQLHGSSRIPGVAGVASRIGEGRGLAKEWRGSVEGRHAPGRPWACRSWARACQLRSRYSAFPPQWTRE